MKAMRRAFTLMEVNLAIFIMATGVLAMVSLYSLGFRESKQSAEDVASASFADQFFAPLVAKLSSPNLTWKDWTAVGEGDEGDAGVSVPELGWEAYAEREKSDPNKQGLFKVKNDWKGTAKKVISAIKPDVDPTSNISGDYCYALVAVRNGATISLAFRASRRRDALLTQPIFYTEVHFQGLPK